MSNYLESNEPELFYEYGWPMKVEKNQILMFTNDN